MRTEIDEYSFQMVNDRVLMSHVRAKMGLVGVQLGQVWGQMCHLEAQIDKKLAKTGHVWALMGLIGRS